MQILVVSREGDGAGLAQRLALEGNHVDLYIAEERYERVARGFKFAGGGEVSRVNRWERAVREADLILADCIGLGRSEDLVRSTNKPFIGFCHYLDAIEADRLKGMELFERAGIAVPETVPFNSRDEAHSVPAKRQWKEGWVIKPSGNQGPENTAVVTDEALWEHQCSKLPPKGACSGILQRVVSGIEVSTEGWFNGRAWLRPFNHTFEEKRFMAGGLGPNTGCMGNVVVNAGRGNRLTKATVERLAPFLTMIDYRGPIDVNCIVTEDAAYGLEATSRFGYDAIEALTEGLEQPIGEMLLEVAEGKAEYMVLSDDPAIAVRLSIPPHPFRAPNREDAGEPVTGIDDGALPHLFLCDLYRDDEGVYRTAGADGVLLKATATGRIDRRNKPDYTYEARRRVYRTLGRINVSGKQYRTDIGARVNDDMAQLVKWGWLSA